MASEREWVFKAAHPECIYSADEWVDKKVEHSGSRQPCDLLVQSIAARERGRQRRLGSLRR